MSKIVTFKCDWCLCLHESTKNLVSVDDEDICMPCHDQVSDIEIMIKNGLNRLGGNISTLELLQDLLAQEMEKSNNA